MDSEQQPEDKCTSSSDTQLQPLRNDIHQLQKMVQELKDSVEILTHEIRNGQQRQLKERMDDSQDSGQSVSQPASHPEAQTSSQEQSDGLTGEAQQPSKPEAIVSQSKSLVVVLMDTNIKNINAEQMFQQHLYEVSLKQINNYEDALKQLDTQETPKVIIVHIAPVKFYKEDTVRALYNIAKKASTKYPLARIIISMLLPRIDTPLPIINEVNQEICKKCGTLHNVHIAHHFGIHRGDMYDNIKLKRHKTGIFVKSLQNCVFGRSSNIYQYFPYRGNPYIYY